MINFLKNLRTIKAYLLIKSFVRSNKTLSALIFLTVALLSYVGISLLNQQSHLYNQQKLAIIAMTSNDAEEVIKAIENIDDYDNLEFVCDRCQKEVYNKTPDSKERDKWITASVTCLAKKINRTTILIEAAKKDAHKPLTPMALLFSKLIIISVIVAASIMLIILYVKYGIRFIGFTLISVGVIGLLGSFAMRTTVSNIYNIGLLHNRQISIIFFSSILIAGIIIQIAIYIVRNRKSQDKGDGSI